MSDSILRRRCLAIHAGAPARQGYSLPCMQPNGAELDKVSFPDGCKVELIEPG
jgi:hypothetical protein